MVEEKIEGKVEAAEEAPKEKVACPDCTVLVADGGKSEFSGKGGVKPGLLNEHSLCPMCEGSGSLKRLMSRKPKKNNSLLIALV